MIKSTKNSQKGQALLITMSILMASFLVGSGLSGLIIYELRSTITTGESVKAFYAAESGLEYQLYKDIKVPPEQEISKPKMSNETNFKISEKTEDQYKTITSIGNSKNIYRALQATY